MKKLVFIIQGLIVCIGIIDAQEVVSSAGNKNSAGGYQISWTLGETVIETYSNGNNILTQGFHQTNLNVTAINELKYPGIKIKVYPNPTNHILNIQSEGKTDLKLQLALFDVNGKILLAKRIINNPEEVSMEKYATGNYSLKITTTEGIPLRRFKIIKR